MAVLALWFLAWSLLWPFSLQDDGAFSFVNPPPSNSDIDNPQYTVGSDVNIEWVGPNDFLAIMLVHVLPHNHSSEYTYVFSLPGNVTNLGGHYTWPMALNGMNLTSSNIFTFLLYIEGEESPRAVTHNFNLTQISTTTSSATSASTTLSSTSVVSTITSAPVNIPTSTGANNVPQPSNGLSTGARAGIGLGVTVGGLAFIAGCLFFWRRRGGQAVAAGGLETEQLPGITYEAVDQHNSDGAATEPIEAPGDCVASELSGSGPPPLEMADTSKVQHH
ncbi:hypothetical protein UA08_01479 [Talaromyces atroroseus]|uniref:Mid2 domain-containing protein n=1 Tax=Talaromyces atroroseus TaxID=1441469 RepID=A0A1Q5QC17_TALAT|nr:hypothetical protein UA08_01479 [Talaromyces atroroseus]OKL63309.1 hypothetical protein UA08_01479 [Talaromyces atroroseus]